MTEAQQGTDAAQTTGDATGQQSANDNGQQQGTFTQEDLKKIAANEKREGKQAAINDLLQQTGAESIDDVLAAYTEYQGIQEAVTTEADRANQRAEKMEKQAQQYQERYTNTLREYALRDSLRDAGINPERLKGAMRLADLSALEVDKDGNVQNIESVVEAVQEEAPEWFAQEGERSRVNAPQTTGTGISRPNTDTYEGQMGGFLNNLLGSS